MMKKMKQFVFLMLFFLLTGCRLNNTNTNEKLDAEYNNLVKDVIVSYEQINKHRYTDTIFYNLDFFKDGQDTIIVMSGIDVENYISVEAAPPPLPGDSVEETEPFMYVFGTVIFENRRITIYADTSFHSDYLNKATKGFDVFDNSARMNNFVCESWIDPLVCIYKVMNGENAVLVSKGKPWVMK